MTTASDIVTKLATEIKTIAGSKLTAKEQAYVDLAATMLSTVADEAGDALAGKFDMPLLYEGIGNIEDGSLLVEQGGVKIATALKGPAATTEAATNA